MTRILVIYLTGAMLMACGNPSSQAGSKPAPAASVTSPVKEADLTKITLSADAESRLGIKTVVVERRAMARTRTVGGEVIAQPGAEVVVTAPFAGTLEASGPLPAPGTSVERGRSIFRLLPLAPSDRDSGVEAERAAGEAAARQELAARRLQRAEMLVKDGSGSRRAVEEAQAELGIANAELKASGDRLTLARRTNAADGGIAIDAPMSGVLRNLFTGPGQAVASGAPLFDVVRLDVVWIRVPVYVGESDEVDARTPVEIVSLGAPADAPGLTARPVPAPPSADPRTAAVDLYYESANTGSRFRPGQRVGVRIAGKASANSLVVPVGALLHDAYGGTWVYELREPRVYARRRVSVADVVGRLAVLTQGPEPGTKVVTDGAAELFGTEFGAGK